MAKTMKTQQEDNNTEARKTMLRGKKGDPGTPVDLREKEDAIATDLHPGVKAKKIKAGDTVTAHPVLIKHFRDNLYVE